MIRPAHILLCLALVGVMREATPADRTVDFILGASAPRPRPFLSDGELLWAIQADGDGYRLVRRIAKVESFEYRNPARGDGTFTGQRLVGPGVDRALVHLSKVRGLVEGPITLDRCDHILVDYSFGRENTAPSPIDIRLGESKFRVTAEVGAAAGGFRSLRVFLESKGRRQEIFAGLQATDPFARLAWIGDIDRDGAPDLLMSVRLHHSVTSHRLYLSSFAEPGQLARHVATVDEDND